MTSVENNIRFETFEAHMLGFYFGRDVEFFTLLEQGARDGRLVGKTYGSSSIQIRKNVNS